MTFFDLLIQHTDHILLFMSITSALAPVVYYLRSIANTMDSLALKIEHVSTIVEACPYCMRKWGREQ